MRTASLTALLFVFWLALSGHYTTMLIVIGVLCAILCTIAAVRMRTVDDEGVPLSLFLGTLTYYPWLAKEIAKSAWSVTKIILNPRLPISPTMLVVKASQKTAAGAATYANSITLTPGTLTVGADGDELTIHALVKDGADDLETGAMDRRVRQFEGST